MTTRPPAGRRQARTAAPPPGDRSHGARIRLLAVVLSLLAHGVLLVFLALRSPAPEGGEGFEISAGWASPRTLEPAPLAPRPIRPKDVLRPQAPREGTTAADRVPPVTAPVDAARILAHRRPGQPAGPSSGRGSPSSLERATLDGALEWITRQQLKDGRWSLTGPYSDAGTLETTAGATALALLALLGDDASLAPGPRRDALDRGLAWLVVQQKSNGDLFDRDEQGMEAHFYTQALGTMALCESLVVLDDVPEERRLAAQRAVEFLASAQNPEQGGWRYRPLAVTGVGDLSVSSWALMALHTARMANLETDPKSFALADRFLSSVAEPSSDEGPWFFRYRPDEPLHAEQRWSMTAAGLLSRQWLGWTPDYPPARETARWLMSDAVRPEWEAGRRNVYAWYLTAQVVHNVGGPESDAWQAAVAQLLAKHQATSGRNAGSWHPTKPAGAFLEWSHGAGRLYITALGAMILETPARRAALFVRE